MGKSDRNKQGIRTGLIGLIANLLLGGGKLTAGILSGSVSILSDAANNLSDAGSSVLTVTSFALGSRAADRDHPFGHGRYEYIAGLLMGVIILVVGVELIVSSVEKIVRPVSVEYDVLALSVLAASVTVKLAMGVFYRIKAAQIASDTLKAASFDSFSDCIVTVGLLAGIFLNRWVSYPLEGVMGLLISLFIVWGGIKLVLSTVKRLLGQGGDAETNRKIRDIVTSDPLISGMHDLRVHDYGPNCKIASVHAEFERDISITDAHTVIDKLEHRALTELGIELVIHCDPIDSGDVTLSRLRHAIEDITRLYTGVSVHDLEINYNAHSIELHICLPDACKDTVRLRELIEGAAAGVLGEGFTVAMTVDVSEA